MGALVVLAGCGGPPAISFDVEVSEQEDLDCDGAASAFRVQATARFGETPGDDVSVALQYRAGGGNYRDIQSVGDLGSRAVSFDERVEVGDISVDDETRVRVVVTRGGFLSSDQIAQSGTEPFRVEPPSEDSPVADAEFGYEPRPVKLNRTATFSANATGNEGCAIVAYRWDFDGDGDPEARGKEVTTAFDRDGRREVRLTVETSANVSRSSTKEILVMHDPDGDGITTARERELGTDPYDPDTDDDLFPDGSDPLPTSPLVPTGALQVLLTALLYFGVYRSSVPFLTDRG